MFTENNIKDIITKLDALQKKIIALSRDIEQLSLSLPKEEGEDKLVYDIPSTNFCGKVVGIDSGFNFKRHIYFDLFFVRCIGVVFDYKDNKINLVQYYPDKFFYPKGYILYSNIDSEDEQSSLNILRLKEEVNMATKLIIDHKPSFCFLDGSILPQYTDKPKRSENAILQYKELIRDFEKLFSVAEENNCFLVGCIKDSRGRRALEIIENIVDNIPKNISEKLNDIVLFNYLLRSSQRSFAFSYSSPKEKHPILLDFDDYWSNKVFAFYIKPSFKDCPFRVEFIANKDNLSEVADKISRVVCFLSSFSNEFSFPSVLIEADLRARIGHNEVDFFYNKIVDNLMIKDKFNMRRNRKPF
ncbi:MAG: DNA double-strand break repair nuclease NurA [Candidatus Diapherotrites archaeon]|nr:DNA double-strand break repair nuclease NurA [Candidatus Diapherotrites archaeon]